MNNEKLILINGHDLIHTHDGHSHINNNILIQVFKQLETIKKRESGSHIAVVFDQPSEEKRWNSRLIPNNFGEVQNLIQKMGIAQLHSEENVETEIAKAANRFEGEVVIYSESKLPVSLVGNPEGVSYNDMQNGDTIALESFKSLYGITHKAFRDVYAVTGLPMRGLTSTRMVPEKEVIQWIDQFNSYENLLSNLDKINPKRSRQIKKSVDGIKRVYRGLALSRKPFELDYESLKPKETDGDLNNWIASFNKKKVKHTYIDTNWDDYLKAEESAKLISDFDTLKSFIKNLNKGSTLVLDPLLSRGVLTGFSYGNDKQSGLIEINDLLPIEECCELLDSLKGKDIHLITSDFKRLNKIMINQGYMPLKQGRAVELEAYVLGKFVENTDKEGIEILSDTYKESAFLSYESFLKKHFNHYNASDINSEHLSRYASARAKMLPALLREIDLEVSDQPKFQSYIDTIERPLSNILAFMELEGVYADKGVLKNVDEEIELKINNIKKRIKPYEEEGFDITDRKSIQSFLYDHLGLKSSNGRHTDKASLKSISDQHELPSMISEYRTLSVIQNNFAKGLVNHINEQTGRIHASFNQMVVVSGRLSSENPNLQGIPNKNVDGRRLRNAFVAREGYKLLAIDYSQVELRVMAHMSGDPRLVSHFMSGDDVHRLTAAEVFNTPFEDVTGLQRSNAKAINFGLIYGMTKYGLANELGTNPDTAEEYQNKYFNRYPGVKKYMDNQIKFARKYGYVETMFGRRIQIQNIKSKDFSERSKAERLAVNASIQGTAAEIMKKAMIQAMAFSIPNDIKMTMQVHDELVFEVPECNAEKNAQKLSGIFNNTVKLSVPLEVDAELGDNWGESHAIDSAVKKNTQKIPNLGAKKMSEMSSDELQIYIDRMERSEFGKLI